MKNNPRPEASEAIRAKQWRCRYSNATRNLELELANCRAERERLKEANLSWAKREVKLQNRLYALTTALSWAESYYGEVMQEQGCPCDGDTKCPLHTDLLAAEKK